VLVKRTQELQDEEDGNIVSNGQTQSNGRKISKCWPRKNCSQQKIRDTTSSNEVLMLKRKELILMCVLNIS
jgi:hypothetical protein